MFKIKCILITIISIIISPDSINAQDIYLGIGGGYTKLCTNELYTSDICKGGLGLKQGPHICFRVKLGCEALPFRTTGFISSLHLNSNETFGKHFIPREVEISSKILSYGLGIEYEIIFPFLSPYVFFNINMNKFSKTSYRESYSAATCPSCLSLARSISNETRYGIAIGLGHEFYFFPKYGIDIYIKYESLNLIGKEDVKRYSQIFKEDNINTLSMSVNLYFRNK